MFRLKVLPVRLVILALVLLCLWLTAPAWTQPLIRTYLQRTFGPTVEFEECRIDWGRRGVQFSNLEIADPSDPLRNLIQANQVWVEFDAESLWTRQWSLRSARWSDVVLGAPRTNLVGDRLNGATPGWRQRQPAALHYNLTEAGKHWLDQVQSLPPVEQGVSAAAFASITKNIRENWERDFHRQSQRTRALHEEIAGLTAELNQSGKNPLRPAEEEKTRIQRLGELESELESVRLWLRDWPQIQEQDLSQLSSSRQPPSAAPLSQASFTASTQPAGEALLISELDLQTAGELVDWSLLLAHRLNELRSTMAGSEPKRKPPAIRGVKPVPGLIIQATEFSGSLQTRHGHLDFNGSCENMTDRPAVANEPLSFQLKAQGRRSIQVAGTLTEKNGELLQSLQIQLLPADVPSSEVGTASSVLITSSPHRMQAEGQLQIHGEQLEGTIVCYHSQLGLYVNALNDIAGGRNVLEKLNRNLATVRNIEVTASISGTTSEPVVHFRSNLSQTFTPALAKCLEEAREQQSTYNQALIEQTFAAVVQSLSDFAAVEAKRLGEELEAASVRVTELDRQPTSKPLPGNLLRKYR